MRPLPLRAQAFRAEALKLSSSLITRTHPTWQKVFPVVSSQVLRHHRTCVSAAMIMCGHVYQVLGGLYIFDCGQRWQPQPEWRRELAHNEGPVETWARADFRNASKGDECSFLKFLLRLPACGHVRSVATGIFSGLSSQRCC